MGIHQLAKLIADQAACAIKENDIKNYFGRKIAIDASMSLYQFLIAIRQEGAQLMTESGETTSHLLGMFYRTIRMIENGIKPVYVFDGKPPQLKLEELTKRAERKEVAEKGLQDAVDAGDVSAIDKFGRRTVKVTHEHTDEVKRLLRLMSVPYIDAPCEAEAQCAEMVKSGVVYAVGTEDMDGLTFGANILLRHLTFSAAKKMPIKEYHLDKVLGSLNLNMDEFVDLCILLGCDYCDTIKGIGLKKALENIQKYRSIENVLEHLDKEKYVVPDNWLYKEARHLFKSHECTDPAELDIKWGNEPDEEGLVEFLVKEKGFQEERVRSGVKKLKGCLKTSTQGRIDSFFTVTSTAPAKRKAEEKNTQKKPIPAKRSKAVKKQ